MFYFGGPFVFMKQWNFKETGSVQWGLMCLWCTGCEYQMSNPKERHLIKKNIINGNLKSKWEEMVGGGTHNKRKETRNLFFFLKENL